MSRAIFRHLRVAYDSLRSRIWLRVHGPPPRIDVALLATSLPSTSAAVVLMRGAVGLHAGIAYREAGRGWRVLHLAMHERLTVDDRSSHSEWAYVLPAVDPIELEVLAAFCSVRAAFGPNVTYGFRFDESKFEQQGKLLLGPGEVGLTCATFIVAMFEHAQIPLLVRDSWRTRQADLDAQVELVRLMRERRFAPPQHLEALEREVGCMRFRAEEVAAASAASDRPVRFARAEASGAQVLRDFLELAA